MKTFNLYGLIFVVIILIPNIVFAIKCKGGFENSWKNKFVERAEQIGRFGCFVFMIINLPKTYFGFWYDNALIVYLSVNATLLFSYCLIWAICFKKSSVFRALALSIIPSLAFLFSGITLLSIPLIVFACIFAPSHILLSFKNATQNISKNESEQKE